MAKAKATNRKAQKGLRMSDSMKEKYAALFIDELQVMEEHKYQYPWVSPNLGAPCNLYRKGRPYRKSNYFWLSMLCAVRGWSTPYFVTKSQMLKDDLPYGGLSANRSVKLDENGMAVISENGLPEFDVEKRFPVIFYKPIHKDEDGNKIDDEDWDMMTSEEKQDCKTYFIQESYLVYNIDQTDFAELYPDAYKEFTEVTHDYKRDAHDDVLEMMIMGGKWRCPIKFGGQQAFYSPREDSITLPKRSDFLGDEKFYATALHEMAHSTAKDLNRDEGAIFGTEDYAMEEFIAELSSACVCSMLGIGKLLDKNHIAYVQSWRTALRTKTDFIPLVIDHVQRCVNFILNRYDQVAKESEGPKLLTAA